MFRIRKIIIVIMSLGFIWSCVSAVAKSPSGGKSTSPISVSIKAVNAPQPGQTVDFVVTASSKFDTQNLIINVHPPANMVLNSGALAWHGAASRDQSIELRFSASFTLQNNQQISVNAAVQNTFGARFAARAIYVVAASTRKKSANDSTRHRQRQGRAVVEYPNTQ